VVTADEAQARRDVLTRFVRALLRAQKFSQENHAETIDAIVKYVKLDRDLIDKAFYHGHLEQSSDPNKQAIKHFWEIMLKSQFISSELDISSFVDTGIYEEALRGLMKEDPNDQYWQDLHKTFLERNI
jgi:NitT/TauT family transport system substrate-binding protein